MMKLVIAADHGGYDIKEKIKTALLEKGHDVADLGTITAPIPWTILCLQKRFARRFRRAERSLAYFVAVRA